MKLINLKEIYYKNNLRFFELFFLTLFIIFLPSFEAPKNIFLIIFFMINLINLINYNSLSNILKNWNSIDLIFLLLIFSCILSAFFSGIKGYEWNILGGMLSWIVFGWIISKRKTSTNEIKWIAYILVISAILPAVWGLSEVYFLKTKSSLQIHSIGHENHSALYLLVIFALVLSIKNDLFKTSNILIDLAALFFIFAIILTSSRTAFLLMIIIICINYYFKKISNKKDIYFFILIIAIFFIFSGVIIKKNQESIENKNLLSGRIPIWNLAIIGSKINPIFGIGNGNWKLLKSENLKTYPAVVNSEQKINFHASHAHSLFISWFIERGLFGFIVLIIFMMKWLQLIIKDYRNRKSLGGISFLFLPSLSAFLATFVAGTVNSTLHHENALLCMLIFGMHYFSYYDRKITK